MDDFTYAGHAKSVQSTGGNTSEDGGFASVGWGLPERFDKLTPVYEGPDPQVRNRAKRQADEFVAPLGVTPRATVVKPSATVCFGLSKGGMMTDRMDFEYAFRYVFDEAGRGGGPGGVANADLWGPPGSGPEHEPNVRYRDSTLMFTQTHRGLSRGANLSYHS